MLEPCGVGPVSIGESIVMQRRRFKQTLSLEERLAEEAKRLREEAKSLPPGARREELLRKARQAETGSHMSEWLSSPGPTITNKRLEAAGQPEMRRTRASKPSQLRAISLASHRRAAWPPTRRRLRNVVPRRAL